MIVIVALNGSKAAFCKIQRVRNESSLHNHEDDYDDDNDLEKLGR